MKKPSRALWISYGLFVVAVVLFVIAGVVGASQVKQELQTVNTSSETPAPAQTAETKPAEQSEATNSSVIQNSSPEAVEPVGAPTAPTDTSASAPAKVESGGHVPFTNEPVTPGDSQSYVGTVGQCPFYEIAGEKGCTPPPDIECNADWSVCTKKGE